MRRYSGNISVKERLFIFPGWGHRISDPGYQSLIIAVSKKYDVFAAPYETRNKFLSLGSTESINIIVKKIIHTLSPQPTDVFLGFSMGAFLVYLVAKKCTIGKVLLCSFPPLWEVPDTELSDLTPEQIKEMRSYDYTAPIGMYMCGEKEGEKMVSYAKTHNGRIIPDTDHEFNNRYAEAVAAELLKE